jgi:hypothetical protein
LNLPAGSYILNSNLEAKGVGIVPFISYSTNPSRELAFAAGTNLFSVILSITDIITINAATVVNLIVFNNGNTNMSVEAIVMTATEVTTIINQ